MLSVAKSYHQLLESIVQLWKGHFSLSWIQAFKARTTVLLITTGSDQETGQLFLQIGPNMQSSGIAGGKIAQARKSMGGDVHNIGIVTKGLIQPRLGSDG